MIYPIYIPSKGRAQTATTPALLDNADVPYTLVVEPQEYDSYTQQYPHANYHVLERNNAGIAYVRNAILALNKGRYWMMDDDLKGLYRVVRKRCNRENAAAILMEAQAYFERASLIAQLGLEYQQIAWSASKPFALNSYCDVCVCIDAALAGVQYRKEVELKEDRDFTLQLLASGLSTLRVLHLAFAAPENGTNSGGLKPVYMQTDREINAVNRLCELWGREIVTPVTKKNGRYDAKINWRYFQLS